MSRRPTAFALAAAVVAATLGGGCGKSDDDQVRDTLTRFESATKQRDYKALCDDLLARELVARLRTIGLPCQLALARGFGSVLQPSIDVEKVKVQGKTALAQITTTAVGQRPSHDTMRLVKQDGKWRIAALSGSQPPAPSRNLEGTPEPGG
jgi:putative lumazine-binding protein